VSHESAGNAHAVTYNENRSSGVGLWQINTVHFNAVRSIGMPAVGGVPLATPIPIWPAR
jgi:hypothetical protein